MILLANYDFYTTKYKGQLSSDLFDSLIPKASFEIESNVNRPIVEEDAQNETVERVACELVDLINTKNSSENDKKLQSISIDGVSKTYSYADEITEEEYEKKFYKIINKLPLEMIRFL